MGITEWEVSKRLKGLSIPLRPNHWGLWYYRKIDQEQLVVLLQQGLPDREIANRLGVKRPSVAKRRAQLGYPPNPSRYLPTKFLLSEVDKGYIAGMIDGEGTISISQFHRNGGITLIPYIKIGNTNKDVITYLHERIGGNAQTRHRPGNDHHKPCYYTVTSSGARVLGLLPEILPYLIIKRKQAELLMEFCQSRFHALNGKSSKEAHYSQREWELLTEIRKLNRKGPPIH